MQIVVDEQIPLVDDLFAGHSLVKKPGEAISRTDLSQADMLWVRTVTQVGEELLAGTSVRFVGTATAGYDHLDTGWLDRNGIAWAYAPGANAVAVAEYVLCVIAALRARDQLRGPSLRAGVIGVGKVGRIVTDYLAEVGFQLVLHDPPRTAREPGFQSTPLAEFENLDLLCLHPALVREGPYPSWHLLDDSFLRRQKSGMVLLNASRGAVLDTQVLLRQGHIKLCLDVWEHEPEINLELLERTVIATPHIAAYSIDAKRRASELLYRQAQKFFQLPVKNSFINENSGKSLLGLDWEKRVLEIFDPLAYSERMREELLKDRQNSAKQFLRLRQTYPWRKSLSSLSQ